MYQAVTTYLGPALRGLFPMLLAVALLVALRDAWPAAELGDILARLTRIGPGQWALSLAATAACFGCFARSEAAVHRALGTRRAPLAAGRSAMAALGVTQVTGLGPLVGLLVRWRCDPAGGLGRAAMVTAASSGAFLAALATLAALGFVSGGLGGTALRIAGWSILAVVAAGLLAVALNRRAGRLPPLPLVLTIAGWAMADAGFAACAFWAFLPEIPYLQVLPAFLLSLGAGLASGLPGGAGSFDLTLAQSLPVAAPGALICAAMAFRMAHVAVPGALALAALTLRPSLFAAPDLPARTATGLAPPPDATRAEAGLLHQPGAVALLRHGRPAATCWAAPHTLAQIGADYDGYTRADTLIDAAWEQGRIPLAYKIEERDAVRLGARGWARLRLGAEAVVDASTFDPALPACRQLRRKLRKAETAGVTIGTGPACPADMARIDRAWQAACGPARGVSMGRYAPCYVAHQRVFTARLRGRAVAFITLHQGAREWTLDLVRWDAEAPDGTMHALVAHAILAARACGMRQVSLAAVADGARWQPRGSEGLRRFKSYFDPRWRPLYAAAPSRLALALGLADLLWCIARPPETAPAHEDDETSAFVHSAHS
ncbi:phosphatidylglycerol lysyltransferase [Palleronia pelagia]|uniref:Phosphatidylglycerol lysyltransferase n=2 Tax=Palleronia pelagia TaxID=387096 RepID=A0A1H8ACW8_9RHOB|nr:phosphatidylglycerol lysyltransferase [Palleronia pelagia]